MKAQELRHKIYDLVYTSEMNGRYHQKKAHMCWWGDKAVKVAVASLAALALVTVFVPESWKWVELTFAFLALVAAVALNAIPVGEWEGYYQELFRAWSELRIAAERLDMRTRDCSDEETVERWVVDICTDLLSRQTELDARECAPNEKLLKDSQKGVNKSRGIPDDSGTIAAASAGEAPPAVARVE
jgi:hypothetical protein